MARSERADSKQRMWAAINQRQNELVDLCARSITAAAPNPPGDTRVIAEFVSSHLASLGLEVDRFEAVPEAPNLLTSLGQPDGLHLIVNSHLDTFAASQHGWTFPPFEGVISESRIYGCGATDMRAGLSVSLFLASLFIEMGIDLPGRLTLAYSSDEEAGGRWGTEWLLRNIPAVRGDACLIGDQNGTQSVAVGEKGMCWMHLSTTGSPSHAAYGGAHSAIRELTRALGVLYSLEDVPVKPSRAQVFPGDLLERVTVNVGKISGGSSPNLVAEEAYADVDLRIPLTTTVEEIQMEVRRLFEVEAIECDIEILRSINPTMTSASSRIASVALSNAEEINGNRPDTIIRLGGSDARFFRQAGIPTVVYGPTPHNMGAPDEYVDIGELLLVAKVHAGIVLDFLDNECE